MSQPLVSDALWAVTEPLLPPEPLKLKGGRPRVPDRAALTGILFVLRSGIPWEMLPQEMGCGSGVTCWRRLRDWQQAGVWERLQRVLLDRLGRRNAIDFRRAALDSASVAAKRGLGDRSQPDGPRQGGHQASHRHRCARHPTRSPADGGQRPPQRRAGRGRRCRPAHPAVLGNTSPQPSSRGASSTAPLLRPLILQATSPRGGIEVSERAVSQSPFCGAQRRPLAPQRSWRMRQQPRRPTSGSP